MRPASTPVRSVFAVCLVAALATAGCESDGELRLDDLRAGERMYVERVVVLERAKAVALADRPRGTVLLDSLAAAWGDSSLAETLAAVPDEPARAAAVGRLLHRILEAELDSLIHAPRPARLAAPLPDPAPAPETPPAD